MNIYWRKDLGTLFYLGIFQEPIKPFQYWLNQTNTALLRTSSAYIGLPIIPREKQGNVSLAFSVQWKEVVSYFKVVVY